MFRNAVRCTLFLLPALFLLTHTPSAQPRIAVHEATFNFGNVHQQMILTHTFWMHSVGTDTVRILDVWPGCGCTEIPLPDSSIAPGDSLPLTIIFKTERFSGGVNKKPRIVSNATDEPMQLTILANVLVKGRTFGPLQIQPEFVDVSQFGEMTRRIASFLVVNTSDRDFELEVSDSTMKSFEVKLPDKVKAGETVEAKIRVLEDKIQTDFYESLTFRIKGETDGVYTVPVNRLYRPES